MHALEFLQLSQRLVFRRLRHTSRFNFFAEIFLTFLRMYGIYWLWRILYTQRPGAFGVDLNQMVTYGVLGMALEIFVWSRPQMYISRQVKSGAIDTDLMKPLDFHFHMLARSTGETLVGFVEFLDRAEVLPWPVMVKEAARLRGV